MVVLQSKESRISLSKKFDNIQSKFRGFANQVQLITILQSEHYPIEQSRVGLVGTLLTRQPLSWFALLFERRAPVLNNFEALLSSFC
jgi:hypothetical protein